jgi:hypothetical protein
MTSPPFPGSSPADAAVFRRLVQATEATSSPPIYTVTKTHGRILLSLAAHFYQRPPTTKLSSENKRKTFPCRSAVSVAVFGTSLSLPPHPDFFFLLSRSSSPLFTARSFFSEGGNSRKRLGKTKFVNVESEKLNFRSPGFRGPRQYSQGNCIRMSRKLPATTFSPPAQSTSFFSSIFLPFSLLG